MTLKNSPRIHLLPTALANQIAAGEVVERPASVVKELLENSLDAGAKSIEITVEKGGLQLIQISDDGNGIEQEDLLLALQRHTTSKIHSFADLEQVQSLGFRGEALASIASIARLTLVSKARAASTAWQAQADGGVIAASVLPAAQPTGTRVEIRDLFYNTPARRKFLRSESTEFHHIEEIVKRLALSCMHIGFSLRHNQRKVWQLPLADHPKGQIERIAKICGQEFVQQAASLDTTNGGVRLSGWLGLPGFSRNQADVQFFYVNGRSIRDKLINHAIRQAFQDYLAPERHPGYILYLDIDPQEIDVNVHPTKHEVRFRNSRWVHDFIWQALRRVLAGEPANESIQQPNQPPAYSATAPDLQKFPQSQSSQQFPKFNQSYTPQVNEQRAFYQQGLQAEIALFPTEQPDLSALTPVPKTANAGKALAVLHQQYLLIENAAGLAILHLPAAQQWLVYQRFMQAIAVGNIPAQPLLIPVSYTTTAEQLARFDDYRQDLSKLGLVLERLGENSIVLRQAPVWLRDSDFEPLLASLIKHCHQHGSAAEPVIAVLANYHGLALPRGLPEATALLADLQRFLLPEQWQRCIKQIALPELSGECLSQ